MARRAGLPLAATLALLPLVIANRTAQAQTWVDNTGVWSNGTNWNTGAPPVPGPTTALVFNASGTQSYTATNDIANPFDLNSVTFNNSGTGQITIAGGALNFTGTTPQIIVNGAGPVAITAPVSLSAATLLTGTGNGNLTLSGGLTATSTGLLTFNNAGNVFIAPGTTVTSTALQNYGSSVFPNTSLGLNDGVNNLTFQSGAQGSFAGAVRVGVRGQTGAVTPGSASTLNVIGTGTLPAGGGPAQIQIGGVFEVGDANSVNSGANGTANLQNAATVSVGGSVFVGAERGTTGVINLTGNSRLTTNSTFQVGGYQGVGASAAGDPVRGVINVVDSNIIANGATVIYNKGAINLDTSGLNTSALLDGSDVDVALGRFAGGISISDNSVIVLNAGSGTASYSGTISGGGNLTVRSASGGTGFVQVLTGTNTFTGVTNIGSTEAGFTGSATLRVDGSLAAGNLVNVTTNGTLAGTGSVGNINLGNATGALGNIAVGANSTFGNIETLNAQSLTWAPNTGTAFTGGLLIDLGATPNISDRLIISGALNSLTPSSSGFYDVAFSAPQGPLTLGQSYTIATFASTNITNVNQYRAFAGTPGSNLTSITGTFSYDNPTNPMALLFTVSGAEFAIPEPGSIALFALGLVPLGVALRRKGVQKA
jgi:hypothetical protein